MHEIRDGLYSPLKVGSSGSQHSRLLPTSPLLLLSPFSPSFDPYSRCMLATGRDSRLC